MLKRSLVLSFFATFATPIALGQPRIAQRGDLLEPTNPPPITPCLHVCGIDGAGALARYTSFSSGR
jgi:hypothetical protein